MRKSGILAGGGARIFASRAAGLVAGGSVRVASAVLGAARHASWYASYLIDGRRGTRD